MVGNDIQVAELHENGDLVGVIRGCIKCVGTGFGGAYMMMGCILGLRVSPPHRYSLSISHSYIEKSRKISYNYSIYYV